MDLVVVGVVAGVLGTLVMDLLNLLFARAGIITKMHMEVLGRMAAGWARGRFSYGHPSEMEKTANEVAYGYVTHYAIGAGLARSCMWSVGISWSEGPHHRYGLLPMASRRR